MPKSIYTARHKAIAAAIRAQRLDAGLTQVAVAKAMGGNWSQPIIASIERGGRRLDAVELLRLAGVVGLDVHVLIDQLKAIPDE